MALEFSCEACGARLRIDDELAGARVKCPKCSAVVRARPTEESQAAGSPFAGPAPAPRATDDVNPYASPAATPETDFTRQAAPYGQAITPGIHRALSETRPWVLFLAVLGFLGAALMGTVAVVMIVMALAGQPFPALLVGGMYVVVAAFYFACAYHLFAYGRRIGSFQRSSHAADLEAALVSQKSFWRLVGIMTVVMILLMVAFTALPIMMGVGLR